MTSKLSGLFEKKTKKLVWVKMYKEHVEVKGWKCQQSECK